MLTPSATSYSDWNKHTRGVMALLQVRGERQLETSNGIAMLRQFWGQEVSDWSSRLAENADHEDRLMRKILPAPHFVS